jgi:hypothetical protein
VGILKRIRKTRVAIASGILLYASPILAQEPIMVVANYPDQELNLSTSAIRNLFMGSPLDLDLTPVNLPAGNIHRVQFNTRVIGLTEARIQSYWAQMRFSGRKQAPIELMNEEEVVHFVSSNYGAVAYLPESTILPNNLQILMVIK